MFKAIYEALDNIGDCSIDVYEWHQSDVRKKRLKKGPLWGGLTKPHPPLPFNGWRLAHAVVKLDHLIKTDLAKKAFGLLHSLEDIVDFDPGRNIRLGDGVKTGLADFYGYGLSGRLGQGLSLLFAQDMQQYSFVAHLASDVSVQAHLASGLSKTKKAADFIFENDKKERMILESKGSFRQDNNDPTKIKSKLKNALEGQVDYWMARIVPSAKKGFAVYSCLRERSSPVPSALIFVDPPEASTFDGIRLPEASVRRQNYAAWLAAMGLRDPATRLRENRVFEAGSYSFIVAEIEGRHFAFARNFEYPFWPHGFFAPGIEVNALKAISSALRGEDGALLALESLNSRRVDREDRDSLSYSIFPDGTFLGNLHLRTDAKYVESIFVDL